MIDDNLKWQIKSWTVYTGRLFLLTWIFQYISNWSKVIWAFTHPLSTKSNDFSKFSKNNNFPVDYSGLYTNWANTYSFLTLPTLKLPIKNHPSSRQLFSSDVVLVSNDHDCKGHYLQKKAIKFEKIKNLMFQVIFIFCAWILIKQVKVSSHFFCCWGKQIFERMLARGMSSFILPRVWRQELGGEF